MYRYTPSLLQIQNFIKIELYFTQLWQYDYFQDGCGPLIWIFKVWHLWHLTIIIIAFRVKTCT